MKKIKVQYVNEKNFKEFGQIIKTPAEGSRNPTHQSTGFKFYGELGLIDTKGKIFELGVCTFKKREMIATQMEQHAKTQELLYAIDGDFIMPIAPITQINGAAHPDMDKVTAIKVRQGEGVIFNDGIWHWAPFPLKETSSVLVGFTKDTALNDIVIKDLKEEFAIEE